jgi:general secretion pathway protein B
MSFILDALKKSESDRQRQSGPSLFEVKVAAPRRRLPVWAIAIVVLLGINVIVVSWILLRHPARPASPAAASSASPAAPAPAPTARAVTVTTDAPPASGASEATAVPSPQQAPRPAPAAAAPAPESPAQGTVRIGGEGAAADASPAAEPTDAAASGSPQQEQALPLYPQLAAAPGASLPRLHLDLHVYAPDPRNRYVMINMHRLQEGDSLPDGVQVIAIRPDGVVLSYQGSRFLLPRD